MPANTLSWDSAQQRQLHRKDKGSRWHPGKQELIAGAIPVADEDLAAPLGWVPSLSEVSAGDSRAGRARQSRWAEAAHGWQQPGPEPGLLHYCQHNNSTADRHLQCSSQGSSKPPASVPRRQGRRQKYEKRNQKGKSLCLSNDQAGSKAKTMQQKGTICWLEHSLIMPTIASHPTISSCRQ